MFSLLHRLIHGHRPKWEMCDYDFLTWRWCCVRCGTKS